MSNGLTSRQKKFVEEFVKSDDKGQAYILAGYKAKDKKAARDNADKLLMNPKIQTYLDTFYWGDLSELQKRFCEKFVERPNATQAYIDAGYDCDRASARAAAPRLLADVSIAAYIAKLQWEREQRTQITLDKAIQHLWTMATMDVQDFWDDTTNSPRNLKDIPKELRCCIQSISFTKGPFGEKRSIKFPDRATTAKLVLQYLGALGDLNVAFATLQKYGFQPRPTSRGYELIDTRKQRQEGIEEEGGPTLDVKSEVAQD